MNVVFVYGTLKNGFSNHRIIEGAEFLGNAVLGTEYTLFSGPSYPFLKAENGPGCAGEIYSVDEDMIRRMDWLEGHPSFYKRTECEVTTEAGERLKAWVYVFQRELREGTEVIFQWEKNKKGE